MISAPRIARWITLKLGTSFVHSHRAPVEHLSFQRGNSGLSFRHLLHPDERDAARFARIPVLGERYGFDGTVFCKKFPELALCHSDI